MINHKSPLFLLQDQGFMHGESEIIHACWQEVLWDSKSILFIIQSFREFKGYSLRSQLNSVFNPLIH